MDALRDVVLRAYRPSDVLAMFHLDQVCFEPRFQFSLHAMRDFAEAPHAVSVVAEVAGEMVGFVIAEVEEENSEAYLMTLDVAPAWRRVGLAGAMMGWIDRRVWALGSRRMSLHVFIENAAAIRFYERLGFRLVGREAGFYGDGADALVYLRELSSGANWELQGR